MLSGKDAVSLHTAASGQGDLIIFSLFATLSHDVACQLSEVNHVPMSLLNMF